MVISNIFDLYYNASAALGNSLSNDNFYLLELNSKALAAQAAIEQGDVQTIAKISQSILTLQAELRAELANVHIGLVGSKIVDAIRDLSLLYVALSTYLDNVISPSVYGAEDLMQSVSTFCRVYEDASKR